MSEKIEMYRYDIWSTHELDNATQSKISTYVHDIIGRQANRAAVAVIDPHVTRKIDNFSPSSFKVIASEFEE